jgi:methylaspartate ammonia-lyase
MIDRKILKRVELLPHAYFQQVERDIGLDGEKLIAYAGAIVTRIGEIGDPDYCFRHAWGIVRCRCRGDSPAISASSRPQCGRMSC